MDRALATNLGENMRRLREQRGLSQHQMARLAQIPRPTWSNLESGEANPTLEVLAKAANALQVRLEELIGPPKAEARHFPAESIKKRQRGPTIIRQLLPEPLPGLEIERMELPPGASFAGIPHTPGTREYLTAERGRIELTAGGVHFLLEAGDVVVFRGDQRHGYKNPTKDVAIAYSVVTFAPI